ncbi:MAG TPA: short-chain dehydrogenase [Acidimicrobiaceae bacterium]|nr:short-chain dehydrogenase [Acidimicrobiaceae bacterium]|tara:strand:- start:741 stop:1487 length:747 start_codon:yes stop_codon:yes gene_type:complete
MGTLDGKSIVVTGASRGIGAAISNRLLAEGALVVAGCRSEPSVGGVTWVPTDVTDSLAVDALMASAMDLNGGLDALVANAGVQVEGTIAETSESDYDCVMDVNVRGVFLCCRSAVRHMRKHGGGAIVNVGSVAGETADHGFAIYNASKGAVHALTRAIAVDHGRDGVRCNAVCPGWITTQMADAAFQQADDPEARRAESAARHPVGRLGSPDDVAGMVAWLVSDDAAFVSGSMFTVDGGLTAQSPIGG